MGNPPIACVPDCREQGLISVLYSIASCLKLLYISQLVDPNYIFRLIFKISLKPIIMGTLSNFIIVYIWRFSLHITHCWRKAFYEDKYDKINELSNFKCNLASHIKKIRDTAVQLGSKVSFFRTWKSALGR